jgi:hypothetical protein
MRSIRDTYASFATVVVVALALMSLASTAASRPHFKSMDGIRHQFRATTSAGDALPDGPHTLTFSIWDDQTLGVQLWSEAQTVVTANGLGSAHLGTVTPIPLDVFGALGSDTLKSYYLEVTLDGEVITPRARFVPVPYAHISERLLGDVVTGPGELVLSKTSTTGETGDYTITVTVDPATATDSFVVSDPGLGIFKGGLRGADIDSAYSEIFFVEGGQNVRVHRSASSDGGKLKVTNIGSSGDDGVSIDVGNDTARISVRSLNTAGDTIGSLSRWTGADGSAGEFRGFDPVSGNTALVSTGASGTQGGTLTVSKSGSSGKGGVSIDAGIKTQLTADGKSRAPTWSAW